MVLYKNSQWPLWPLVEYFFSHVMDGPPLMDLGVKPHPNIYDTMINNPAYNLKTSKFKYIQKVQRENIVKYLETS